MATPMPMKLPSGQVIWVRVSDDWQGDEDADEQEDAAYGAPADPGAAPGGGYGAASGNGDYGGYGAPAPSGADSDHDYAHPTTPYETSYPPLPQQPYGPPQSYPQPYTPPSAPPAPYSPPAPYAPPPPPSGRFGLRRGRKAAAPSLDAPQQLHGFTDAVSGVAESVRAGLSRAAPDTVEIEFGLDIDVTSGVAISLIADARAKAAVRIKLGWDNSPQREQPGAAYPAGGVYPADAATTVMDE
jgi:hypothetical protein